MGQWEERIISLCVGIDLFVVELSLGGEKLFYVMRFTPCEMDILWDPPLVREMLYITVTPNTISLEGMIILH